MPLDRCSICRSCTQTNDSESGWYCEKRKCAVGPYHICWLFESIHQLPKLAEAEAV